MRCSLAVIYFNEEKFDEAETLFLECVASQKLILTSSDVAEHKLSLASSLYSLGRIIYNIDHNIDLLINYTYRRFQMKGDIYVTTDRLELAESHYNECYEIRSLVLGDTAESTIAVMSSLATLFEFQERYEKASEMYSRVLALQSQLYGEDSPEVTECLSKLKSVKMSREDT